MKRKILILLGSTKANSANQKIAQFFTNETTAFFEVETYPLSILPYFNPDLETGDLPTTVAEFRSKIEASDGVFICTPEYVFSIPGILKNALEWTVSTMIFHEKPMAIITAASSGETAHASIQLIIKTIGGVFDEKTSLLISSPKSKMDNEGNFTNLETKALVENLIQRFRENID